MTRNLDYAPDLTRNAFGEFILRHLWLERVVFSDAAKTQVCRQLVHAVIAANFDPDGDLSERAEATRAFVIRELFGEQKNDGWLVHAFGDWTLDTPGIRFATPKDGTFIDYERGRWSASACIETDDDGDEIVGRGDSLADAMDDLRNRAEGYRDAVCDRAAAAGDARMEGWKNGD